MQNVIAPPKEKTKPVRKEEKASADEGLTADSSSNADSKSEKPNNTGEHFHDAESPFDARSEDGSARSPLGSPTGRSTLESPSQEFRESHFGKSFDSSPRAKETQRYGNDNGLIFFRLFCKFQVLCTIASSFFQIIYVIVIAVIMVVLSL